MLFINSLFNVNVEVQIGDPPSRAVLVNLNLKDNLSNIRKKLGYNSEIEMDDTLSFAQKKGQSSMLAKIAREDEGNFILNDIVVNDNFLYITKNSKPGWKILNYSHKLDFGRIVTSDEFKEAKQRAFIMKDCKMTELGARGCRIGSNMFNSSKDRMMKTNLFFTMDVDAKDFVKLGISTRRSQNEKVKSETNSTYKFTEFAKVSLKFSEYLKPTEEFEKEVRDTIESKNPRNFKKITEKFGQFIPTEVILGGRAY